ncbi:MAG: recombination protein RecR [Ilumatobacteraceae bacterium]|jgi:recombination protein RecR|nr:recombination protein RecR [Ilumatobacteraceae bacterium]MBJ7367323.1 recombination protein RecR [Ilumatobacteraceae bacterium]MBJ7488148.1 recombination protein RecR [Ilumatobacteraceae bacterium]MCX6527938.1 recombination mediator RecR [Actinomycetota bacterium]GDX29485.1 recombination protein RecR [Actinomycetes bacterium]
MASPYTPPIQTLIDEFGKLPGVGPRSAQRIAMHIVKMPREDVNRLAHALTDAKDRVRYCDMCFNLSESEKCSICSDDRRDSSILCAVEDSRDVVAIERTGEFRGRYHVLQGALDPLQGIGPEQLKIKEMFRRLAPEGVTEVIVCTNPNTEGEVTALYLARLLEPLGIKATRIASGLPVGGDLEYADEITLGRALGNRRTIEI